MDISGTGKSSNAALSFRYNANNEELEELYNCEDDPPTPQCDVSPTSQTENASPKKVDKTSSLIDKYFKRVDKQEKIEETKPDVAKIGDDVRGGSVPKEVSSSPVKDYINKFGKRGAASEGSGEVKDPPNETWKIFHDFRYKIAQAMEDIKSRSAEETRDKSVVRDNSMSDSEENSVIKDCDQHSVGDTDNQVSSLDSSIQNLSELTQPVTAKVNDGESSLPVDKEASECSDNTHTDIGPQELDASRDFLDDSLMDVESGVEALEESHLDAISDIAPSPVKDSPQKRDEIPPPPPYIQPITANFSCPPNKNDQPKTEKLPDKPKSYFFNFLMVLLTALLLLSYILLPNSNLWNGFLLGLWVYCFFTELKRWVLDTYFCEWESDKATFFQVQRNVLQSSTYTIPSVKEHRPMKKFEGWINHYRWPEYDPFTYHINKTTTAFMKLEGCNLRISYTRAKIAKRELWDEKIDKVEFYQHRLYNLSGARVILLPTGLVRRRQWSKKYPICVILSEKENIQVLEKEAVIAEKRQSETQTEKKGQVETECAETNTSPEKKKKFVWRKREKIIHSDSEVGKEGLRHRLVRKIHRDKKGDSSSIASACTDPGEGQTERLLQPEEESIHESMVELSLKSINSKDDPAEEELDETELSRIKDFLEETELDIGVEGAAEGEWSIQVKQSRDRHAHLYLFARTGRDKHEWFRRLTNAIQEASETTECSVSDEKPVSEGDKDIEMAVFKVSERDTVAFAKPNNKSSNSISETVTITSISQPLQSMDMELSEKMFWPYLFKIIQTHEVIIKRTSEIGIMCQIDPAPDQNKGKRKKKTDNKTTANNTCSCRTLPGEVTWINTLLARLLFDVMRSPDIAQRLQARVQRKLRTLKLPSFMSPLHVTEIQLHGACPLVERVSGPSWDERGVWLDADLRYDGGAYISILTQINLMKLKEKTGELDEPIEQSVEQEVKTSISGGVFTERPYKKKKPAVYDSEVEDSAESSSDDETPLPLETDSTILLADSPSTTTESGGSSKKKFLRMVDKIATNKYFQQVTEYKYVKRAMEGLSNTDIKLQLDVRALRGRLALNLPPPPHDRLWIGFRTNPQLILKAKPAFGARTLRFNQISNWIEQKLTREFEKVLVLPNMEDIVIDLMTPTPVDYE